MKNVMVNVSQFLMTIILTGFCVVLFSSIGIFYVIKFLLYIPEFFLKLVFNIILPK